MTLYDKNWQRNLNAIHMEKVDKIPFSLNGCVYVATRQGVKIADFLNDHDLALQTTIDFIKEHPGVDSVHSPTMATEVLTMLWNSRIKNPGVELSDNETWQVDEQEVMSFEDYEKIIEGGYEPWYMDFMLNKMGNPFPKLDKFKSHAPIAAARLRDEVGIPLMNYNNTPTPIEGFCGGRTLMNFFMDIMDDPDTVKKAMDQVFAHTAKGYEAFLKTCPPAVWIGGWRAAPELMGHETFMEFVWPYMEKLILMTIEAGTVPILHFDSCWESELETIKTLPAKKCLLMLDGTTDMRKARAVLDDRMALMGDVPATMLAFGSADEVYNYTKKLIDDVGPKTGLIVSSGCDLPPNAKHENVDAMIQTTVDYVV